MLQAIEMRDMPLMMGAFLVITIGIIIGVLVADLTYGMLDPRASRGGGAQ
jgi:peptide/nickel transport system permease protein